ncbi:MAG: hypothetical protein HY301_11765 [Verrucomicrobia bacterium]|nr:hypothetical protein [Verrucomicrobiota bacterium]
MSASKLDVSGVFQPVSVTGNKTSLNLPASAVRVRKNGIEFQSASPISLWTEMSVELRSPRDAARLSAHGIVVACAGTRHAGYLVTMLFLNLSARSQQQLSEMSCSQLS